MDVCDRLETDVLHSCRGGLPPGWRSEPWLSRHRSFAELVTAIRQLDDGSDAILTALIRQGRDDPNAAAVIVVALLPLILARCDHDLGRVDELIGEVAIVVGEYMTGRCQLGQSSRRVANLLLDRAWGKVRVLARRIPRNVPADPQTLCRQVRTGSRGQSGWS